MAEVNEVLARSQAEREEQARRETEEKLQYEKKLRVGKTSESFDELGYRSVHFEVKNSARRICKYAVFRVIWYDAQRRVLDSDDVYLSDLADGKSQTLKGSSKNAGNAYRHAVELQDSRWE